MITFFDDQDLISFGSYMLSEERKQSILQSNESEEVINEALKYVTPFDFGNWYQMRTKQQGYENYIEDSGDEEGEDEDLILGEYSEDEGSKIIQMTPRV